MARQWENDVLPLCGELNIGFVAYSPMAGGFLSAAYKPETVYTGDDIRRVITRYSPDNVRKNQPILTMLQRWGKVLHGTPAQVALAYLLYNPQVVVLPGMRTDARLQENLGAAEVSFNDEQYQAFRKELNALTVYGDRKDSDIAKLGTIDVFVDKKSSN